MKLYMLWIQVNVVYLLTYVFVIPGHYYFFFIWVLIASACVLFSDLNLGRRRFLGRRTY